MAEKLVVASKIKEFIKKTAGLNTSASVIGPLSKVVEKECLKAIEKAKKAHRKTVLARDFECDNISTCDDGICL